MQEQKPRDDKKRGFIAVFAKILAGPGGGGLGGLLATKTGLIALAAIGTTVAGGIGYVAVQGGGTGSGGSARGGEQAYNSIFAKRERPAGTASGSRTSGEGRSDSLQFLADGNKVPVDPGAGAAPPTATATAEGGANAAFTGAPPPVASEFSGPNLGGPASGSGAPGAKLQGGSKFGALSKGGGGGSGSSAASSTMDLSAARAVLSGGRAAAGSSTGLTGRGRASLASQRGRGRTFSDGAGRQLLSTRKDIGGASSFQSGGCTVDGGCVQNAEVGNTEGEAGSGGTSKGQADKGPSATPGADGLMDIPPVEEGNTKSVTPWKKTLMMASMAIMGAGLLLLAATVMLQWYHEKFVAAYNAAWALAYKVAFQAAQNTCGVDIGTCYAKVGNAAVLAGFKACGGACTAFAAVTVGFGEAPCVTACGGASTAAGLKVLPAATMAGTAANGAVQASAGAKTAASAAKAAAEEVKIIADAQADAAQAAAAQTGAQTGATAAATASDASVASTKAAPTLTGGLFSDILGGIKAYFLARTAVAGSTTQANAASGEADRAATLSVSLASAKAGVGAAELSFAKDMLAICSLYGPVSAAAGAGAAGVAACNAASRLTTACDAKYITCMNGATGVAQKAAIDAASETANTAALQYKVFANLLGGAALAAGLFAVTLGTATVTGKHKQAVQGAAVIAGGALMAGAAGLFLAKTNTLDLHPLDASVSSGALKVESIEQLPLYSNFDTAMKVAGVVGLLTGVVGGLAKPKEQTCKTDADCKKLQKELFGQYERYPSEDLFRA